MAVYKLKSVSIGRDFSAAWFDNDEYLWDDERLRRPASLIGDWKVPTLKLHEPERGATPVLYNPHAFAVSQGVCEELSVFDELEFLPIDIEGHGRYFILHIVPAYEVPEGSVVLRPEPPVNGNIVQIDAFPASFEPSAAFFRILQPRNSPAGKAGRCVIGQYATSRGSQALFSAAGQYIAVHAVSRA